MKKLICLILCLMLAITCCACQSVTATQPPESQVTEPPTDPPTDPPPAHSDLYLPEVSVEQMITYFNEVVLNMEYSTGNGDVSLVQKWTSPIHYKITGDPTDEDLEVLNGLFEQLNAIPGFPGFIPEEQGSAADLTLRFVDYNEFRLAFSQVIHGENADAAMQFWYYTDTNVIYSGQIGYRTDISQEIRNSVIIEEIVNILGLSDTVLRQDSIVYQYGSEVTVLSDIDLVILKILYNPAIKCSMNAEACQQIIEELYY